MASTYLTRTPSSSGNRNKWTFSGWVKRSQTSAEEAMFSCYQSNDYYTFLRFEANGRIKFIDNYNGSANFNLDTNARYRDTSAWYHVVAVFDKDNSTSTDKAIIYINGEKVTSFSSATYPSQSSTWNTDNLSNAIGSLNTGQYWNGLMSDINFSDGYALSPTVFGETDTDTGEWRIKDNPSFTLGTNGFTILRNGNTITDQSTNSNNFTIPAGILTNTKDCPSNVFATFNSLANFRSGITLSSGNTKLVLTNNKGGSTSTLSIPSNKGKFYVEAKVHEYVEDERFNFGIMPQEFQAADDPVAASNKMIGLSGYNGAIYANGGNVNAFYGQNFTSPANWEGYLAMAVDLTSATKTIAYSVNGAWITGTNATSTDFANALKVDISSYLSISSDWNIAFGNGNSSGNPGMIYMNFGNGTFNTTPISSPGTNASGNGVFKYNVPTGYTALSTKGLNL